MSPHQSTSGTTGRSGSTGTTSVSTASVSTGPQDMVERALAAARSDDCIVIGRASCRERVY